MQKSIIGSCVFALLSILFFACKKNSVSNNNPSKTKTDLITASLWRFDNATMAGVDVSGYFNDCEKDNTVTFVSNGTGTIDEGPTKCDPGDPQTTSFNWAFQNNETTIHTTTPLFPGTGDFKISTLNETQLSVSRDTVIAGLSQTFTVNLKH